MPADQRVRLHDRERGSPVNQLGEHDEGDPRRIIGTAGFDSALPIERQLLPEKEILGRQARPRLKAERHEHEDVDQHAYGGPPHHRRGRGFPHARACHKLAMPWNPHSTRKFREFRLGPNNCGSQPSWCDGASEPLAAGGRHAVMQSHASHRAHRGALSWPPDWKGSPRRARRRRGCRRDL